MAAAAETLETAEAAAVPEMLETAEAAEILETPEAAAAPGTADAGWRCTATASGGPSGARPEDTDAGRNNRNEKAGGRLCFPLPFTYGAEVWPENGRREKEVSMNRKKAGLMVCLGLLMAGTVLPETALADTVYVTAGNLNCREGRSTESAVLGTVPRGTKIQRESDDGTWSQVTVGGKTCYVASRYLSSQSPAGNRETDSGREGTSAVQTHEKNVYVESSADVFLDKNWEFASFSKINSGAAVYYKNGKADRKGKTVCVNAGHGTRGGSSVKTLCHPDGSPKVTGGTTGAGAVYASAISSGMTFSDGTPESTVTLAMAKKLKDKLLAEGYDVLMIREEADVQMDNVARTVIANNTADIHISLHWDSTASNKGCFYMSVPDHKAYRSMEPVASHWQSHNALGESLVKGLQEKGSKIFSSGSMAMDLTQTSYSTIPSVDIELGDKASDHSDAALEKLADGLVLGIGRYLGTGQ